jgi:hypothetical protein
MSVAPVTAGGDGDEDGAELAVIGLEQVDALDEDGFGLGADGGCRSRTGFAGVGGESLFGGSGVALDERLDGDGEGVGLVRGGDLGGGGEAGTKRRSIRRLVEGDDDLEVLGLLGAGGGLAGGDAGGAEQGLVADLGDVAFEDAAGQGVDGDVGGLAELRR